MIKLTVNGTSRNVDADPDTPLLWVLREWLGMTGTKYGCGIAQCGACTVHIDGVATRSCQVPVGSVGEAKITTIEGLSSDGLSHPVQVAWLQHDVPQCGYCQSGQIMAAAALLKANPKPTDADIDAAITNICRCGTYQRIREAIHTAASRRRQGIGSGTMSNRLALRRRSFLGTIAAAGGGLALGWRIPAGRAHGAGPGGQAVGIWVVISPDDTTIGAHRPLGNGSGHVHRPGATRRRRTGLRLAACARGIRVAGRKSGEQARLGRHVHRRQPRHSRFGGLRAQGWRGGSRHVDRRPRHSAGACRRRECTAANSVITHTPSGRTLRYGEVAADAAKLPVPTDVKLKTPAQWTIIGKGVKRLDTVDKLSGKQVFAIDVQLPDMLNAAIAQCPVYRRHAEILRCRQDQIDAGRAPGRRGGRQRGRGGGRQVVPGEDRARRVADRLERRRRRHGGQRADRRTAEDRPGREGSGARPEARRRRGGARRCGEGGRGGVRRAVPRPRHDGADELHGEVRRRQGGDLGAVAERRCLAGRGGRGRGREAGRREGEQAAPRRRLRPARAAGLHAPGRADREAGAGAAGEADLVARRGHDARLLPADHAVQAACGAGCRWQRRRAARAAVGPVDPRLSRAVAHGERRRSYRVPELDRGGVRLQLHPATC